MAWQCGVGDINNNTTETRFSVATGEAARLSILYSNGWTDSFTTDDSSQFQRLVTAGLHKIVVSTQYTWPPDTFQFYIESDTTVELNLVYRVLDPDTLLFTFSYESSQDSLGAREEWNLLRILNGQLGGAIDTWGHIPRLEWRSVYVSLSRIYVHYGIPLSGRGANHVVVVADSAATSIAADPRLSPWLSVYPKGIYFCLH